jgi:phospholipid/cholesterol/gamma-HCH transport system permease protein
MGAMRVVFRAQRVAGGGACAVHDEAFIVFGVLHGVMFAYNGCIVRGCGWRPRAIGRHRRIHVIAERSNGNGAPLDVKILRPFGALGRVILVQFEHFGTVTMMLVQVARSLPRSFRYYPEIVRQMSQVGVSSMGLVTLTSLFVGAVTTVQARYQFTNLVPDAFLGTVVAKSVFIELGPVLTGLVVAPRFRPWRPSWARCASPAGGCARNAGDQPDRIPAGAAPRPGPLLAIYADLLAILGGLVVAVTTLNVSSAIFVQTADVRDGGWCVC